MAIAAFLSFLVYFPTWRVYCGEINTFVLLAVRQEYTILDINIKFESNVKQSSSIVKHY